MEPLPPPTRPNFEGMGNRLYQSGSYKYGDLTNFMDPKHIDFTRPSTLPQQKMQRNYHETGEDADAEPRVVTEFRGTTNYFVFFYYVIVLYK